jgi:hypothetical protein
MMRASEPLHHVVRVRSSDDLTFLGPGLMDEILINANQLENSIQSTAAALWKTTLPFSVDPVLWRFQLPEWSRNAKGDTKRNYQRLGAAYSKSLGVTLGPSPLLATISAARQWSTLARNVIDYQRDRLRAVPTQLELMADLRELAPSRFIAPALVAFSTHEDRINQLMIEASLDQAQAGVVAQVIIPIERLLDRAKTRRLVRSLPSDGITSYAVWTPMVREDRLLTDPSVLEAVLGVISELAARGVAVSHQYGNYTIAALHDIGISSVTHHLGWVDKGEPAIEQQFAMRSCQTYVPGVRHSIRFREAERLGGDLGPSEYADRYCSCAFCTGLFEINEHPFDLLLETQTVVLSNGQEREIPTARSVGANTWHFLLSRRDEIEEFSAHSALDVVGRDIARAAELKRGGDVARLASLATGLRSA